MENIEHISNVESEKTRRESCISAVRMISGNPEEETWALEAIKREFENQEIWDKRERQKTPQELVIIEEVLPCISSFVKQYGIGAVPLTEKHFHFFNESDLHGEELHIRGSYNQERQGIIIADEYVSKLHFARTLAHEIMHANAFQVMCERDKGQLYPESGGFLVKKNDDTKSLFVDLNEAVTEMLTERFSKEFFRSMPVLQDEIEESEKIRQEHENLTGVKEISNEIYPYMTKDAQGNPKQMFYVFQPYKKERAKLCKILSDIQNTHSQVFKSSEDVFQVFAQAYFKGDTSEVERLMEETYGEGSFDKLGKDLLTFETKENPYNSNYL